MKQSTVFLITATIIGLLLAASFGWSTKPIARAESNSTVWQVSVNGLVKNPSNFTLADLEALPQTTVSASLICVGSPGVVLSEGNWTGVQLWTLIKAAGGASPGAIKVAFKATDGFSTDQSIASAQNSSIVLAYAENGNPLTDVVRLVVPGEWGYKWIDNVTAIQLVNYNFLGTYESVGYDDNGVSAARTINIPTSVSTESPSPTSSFSLSMTNYIIISLIAILIATATATVILGKRKRIQAKNSHMAALILTEVSGKSLKDRV